MTKLLIWKESRKVATTKEFLNERLDYIASLEDGWNEEGSKAIKKEAIDYSHRILNEMNIENLEEFGVFPNYDEQGVSFENFNMENEFVLSLDVEPEEKGKEIYCLVVKFNRDSEGNHLDSSTKHRTFNLDTSPKEAFNWLARAKEELLSNEWFNMREENLNNAKSEKVLIERIESFRELENGWNGPFSKTIETKALDYALKIVKELDSEILHSLDVYPTKDGGITFDSFEEEFFYIIEIENNIIAIYNFEVEDDSDFADKKFSLEAPPEEIIQWLHKSRNFLKISKNF